jgi:hypothetical protein
MCPRRLRRLYKRLHELQVQAPTRDQLLLKIGAAKKETGRAFSLVKIHLPNRDAAVTPETFTFGLDRKKLRQVRRREGRYLLRSSLCDKDPAKLWTYYILRSDRNTPRPSLPVVPTFAAQPMVDQPLMISLGAE